MKKVIKLKESDIENLVKRIIKEDESRPMVQLNLKKLQKIQLKQWLV